MTEVTKNVTEVAKNMTEVTKNVTEVAKKYSRMKIVLKVTKSLLYLFLSYFTAMCGLLQLNMVLFDHFLCPFMLLWSHTAIKLSFMAFHGKI